MFRSQTVVGDKLVGDDLDAYELGDLQQIVAGHAEQEGHGVTDVAQDELQGEVRFAVLGDVDVSTPPAQEAVDQADQGDDAEQGGDDHSGDLDAQPGPVGEGVEGVRGPVLVVVRDDAATRGDGLLRLRVPHLTHGQRRGDGHDAARDQGLGVQPETDVGHEDRTGDGGEPRSHDLVEFGQGQVRHKGPDEHGGFALADER